MFEFMFEYKVKFVRGESGEKEAYFTMEGSYRNLFKPNQEGSEFVAKIE